MPGSTRGKLLQSYFDQFASDIVVLTETHQNLRPTGDYVGVHSGTPDYSHADGECMCSIWSKMPLLPLIEHVSDKARCTAARATLSDDQSVVVCAIVLPWIGDDWQKNPSRDGQAFSRALDCYREDWRRLRTKFPKDDFILAGDFNQDLIAGHYYGSKHQKSLLKDALLADGLVPLTAGADDPVHRDSSPHACIDHICISTESHFVLDTVQRWPDTPAPDHGFSDHFAITVKLK